MIMSFIDILAALASIAFLYLLFRMRGLLINIGIVIVGVYGVIQAMSGGDWGWGILGLIAILIGAFNAIHMIKKGEIIEPPSDGSYSSVPADESLEGRGSEDGMISVDNKNGTLYKGSSWLSEEPTGRIVDGDIYKGTGLLEEIIGRIDEDGNIYKGTGVLEEIIGRIDEGGDIYKGTGFLEEVIGRIDEDGNIYSGSSWLFEENIGRLG
jgi:hypothetical protein